MKVRTASWKHSTTHNPLWVALHIVLGYSERELMYLAGMTFTQLKRFRLSRRKLPLHIQYRMRGLLFLNAKELHNIRLASTSDHMEYLAYNEMLRHMAKWLLTLTKKDMFGEYEVETYRQSLLPSRVGNERRWRNLPGHSPRILVVDFYTRTPTKKFRVRKSRRRVDAERRAARAERGTQGD